MKDDIQANDSNYTRVQKTRQQRKNMKSPDVNTMFGLQFDANTVYYFHDIKRRDNMYNDKLKQGVINLKKIR